jgi:hypothetical protein
MSWTKISNRFVNTDLVSMVEKATPEGTITAAAMPHMAGHVFP